MPIVNIISKIVENTFAASVRAWHAYTTKCLILSQHHFEFRDMLACEGTQSTHWNYTHTNHNESFGAGAAAAAVLVVDLGIWFEPDETRAPSKETEKMLRHGDMDITGERGVCGCHLHMRRATEINSSCVAFDVNVMILEFERTMASVPPAAAPNANVSKRIQLSPSHGSVSVSFFDAGDQSGCCRLARLVFAFSCFSHFVRKFTEETRFCRSD